LVLDMGSACFDLLWMVPYAEDPLLHHLHYAHSFFAKSPPLGGVIVGAVHPLGDAFARMGLRERWTLVQRFGFHDAVLGEPTTAEQVSGWEDRVVAELLALLLAR
jgi:hypothetical protein